MIRLVISIIALTFLLPFCMLRPDIARGAQLNITITPSTITFPDDDPDIINPSTANSPVDVNVDTNGLGTSSWSLYALSRGNLVAGTSSIPISNITWKAIKNIGDPQVIFYDGAMTTATPGTLVGGGIGRDKPAGATLTFFIKNLWTYATGYYTQVTDFIVTSP